MSREGPGVSVAAAAEAAHAEKAKGAETAGYIVPGLRAIDVQVRHRVGRAIETH